jgi:hypothetical protein
MFNITQKVKVVCDDEFSELFEISPVTSVKDLIRDVCKLRKWQDIVVKGSKNDRKRNDIDPTEIGAMIIDTNSDGNKEHRSLCDEVNLFSSFGLVSDSTNAEVSIINTKPLKNNKNKDTTIIKEIHLIGFQAYLDEDREVIEEAINMLQEGYRTWGDDVREIFNSTSRNLCSSKLSKSIEEAKKLLPDIEKSFLSLIKCFENTENKMNNLMIPTVVVQEKTKSTPSKQKEVAVVKSVTMPVAKPAVKTTPVVTESPSTDPVVTPTAPTSEKKDKKKKKKEELAALKASTPVVCKYFLQGKCQYGDSCTSGVHSNDISGVTVRSPVPEKKSVEAPIVIVKDVPVIAKKVEKVSKVIVKPIEEKVTEIKETPKVAEKVVVKAKVLEVKKKDDSSSSSSSSSSGSDSDSDSDSNKSLAKKSSGLTSLLIRPPAHKSPSHFLSTAEKVSKKRNASSSDDSSSDSDDEVKPFASSEAIPTKKTKVEEPVAVIEKATEVRKNPVSKKRGASEVSDVAVDNTISTTAVVTTPKKDKALKKEKAAPTPKSTNGEETKSTKKGKSDKPHKLSGYQLFSAETRQETKDKNPEATFGALSAILGKLWNDLDDKSKQNFKDRAEEMPPKVK